MSPPWPVPVVAVSPVACGSVVWRMRGITRVTVIVKATFGLVHEHSARLIAPAELVREDRWREAPGSVEEASEVAPYLAGAGVLLRGTACTPGGQPATGVTVRLAIFRDRWILDKTLHVFGDRAPQAPPRPFQRMSIIYERAYGGPAIEDNPVGIGAGEGARQLANVVDPADPTRPAGFGPIPREWPARRRLVPRPQRSGLALAVPEIPEGFDWRYFQAAPKDQQIDAIRGDEWIFVEGMHPDKQRLQSRLPSARAVAMWFPETARGVAQGRPVELTADTLTIDADRQVCALIWRGSFVPEGASATAKLKLFAGVELPGHPVVWPRPEELGAAQNDAPAPSPDPDDGDDPNATTMKMVAKRRPGEAPPPSRLERSAKIPVIHEDTEDDPNAGTRKLTVAELAASALKPIAPFAIAAPGERVSSPASAIPGAPFAASAPSKPAAAEAEEHTKGIDIEALRAGAGKAAPFAIAAAGARPEEPARAIPGAPWSREQAAPPVRPDEGGETAMIKLPRDAIAAAERGAGIVGETTATESPPWAAQAGSALPFMSPPTGPMPRITPSEPPPRLGPMIVDESTVTATPIVHENVPIWLARAAAEAEAAAAPHIVSGPPPHIVSGPPPHIVSAPPAPPPPMPAVPPPIAAAPPPPIAAAPPMAAAAPATGLRADVLARIRAGEPLRGLELAGADLRDLDLRGAFLASCDLKGTNLSRCNFEGARLSDAQLAGADLTGANLVKADLSRADLSRAVLADARLDGAQISDANFSSARGSGASFSGVTGQRVTFARGTWDGASFGGAELRGADFTGASLNGARFEGASLVELRLEDVTGVGAVFDGAKMPDVEAQRATLTGGSFAGAEAPGSNWERAALSGSIFRGAKLSGANLTRVTCDKASFAGADLKSANLQRISGDGAVLARANLEGADLRHARLEGAIFDEAVLKGLSANKADLARSSFARADLRAAVLRSAKLKDADLTRAELDGADLRDADLERANVTGANRQGAKMNGANTRDMIEGEPGAG